MRKYGLTARVQSAAPANVSAAEVPRSSLLGKLRRGLAGDLPERMREGGDAGVAEIGSQLLDRDGGLRRQPFDRGRDTGALAPGLETQLGFRGEQPRQRPRRRSDRLRQGFDLVRAGGIAEHD